MRGISNITEVPARPHQRGRESARQARREMGPKIACSLSESVQGQLYNTNIIITTIRTTTTSMNTYLVRYLLCHLAARTTRDTTWKTRIHRRANHRLTPRSKPAKVQTTCLLISSRTSADVIMDSTPLYRATLVN